MKIKELKLDQSCLKDVGDLYLSAFPSDERPPLKYYLNVHNETKDNHIFAYYEKDEFIGYIQFVIYQDIVYLCYLAISENKRNQGYGTYILKDIISKYQGYVILLCYEEIDKKYPNYEQRIKRENLYKKIGFIDNHLFTKEGDVIYQSAYIGKHPVDYQTYQIIFDLCYGKNAHEYYLRNVIK